MNVQEPNQDHTVLFLVWRCWPRQLLWRTQVRSPKSLPNEEALPIRTDIHVAFAVGLQVRPLVLVVLKSSLKQRILGLYRHSGVGVIAVAISAGITVAVARLASNIPFELLQASRLRTARVCVWRVDGLQCFEGALDEGHFYSVWLDSPMWTR